MIIKYGFDIQDEAIEYNIRRLINQIFKLLPSREEGADWEKNLDTVLEELSGMDRLLLKEQNILFSLLCRLEGLYTLTKENDFLLYRKTIFECISLLGDLKDKLTGD